MKINYSFIAFIGLVMFFISGCYSYGPIHKPYGYNKRTPEYKTYYINKTYNEVKTNIPEASIEIVKDSIKILFPDHIIYQLQEIEPSMRYKEPLDKLSSLLQTYNETNLLITGHCDNSGTVQLNKKLSANRAAFIKKYLVQTGMNSTRIETWGLGSSAPIESNNTPEGRKKNRRVEFVVLYDSGE